MSRVMYSRTTLLEDLYDAGWLIKSVQKTNPVQGAEGERGQAWVCSVPVRGFPRHHCQLQ